MITGLGAEIEAAHRGLEEEDEQGQETEEEDNEEADDEDNVDNEDEGEESSQLPYSPSRWSNLTSCSTGLLL